MNDVMAGFQFISNEGKLRLSLLLLNLQQIKFKPASTFDVNRTYTFRVQNLIINVRQKTKFN